MSKYDELMIRVASAKPSAPEITASDLDAVATEVEELAALIGQQPDFGCAEPALKRLASIQEFLALIAFKHKFKLPTRLSRLVRQFDRSDDLATRVAVYDECRMGTFLSADD